MKDERKVWAALRNALGDAGQSTQVGRGNMRAQDLVDDPRFDPYVTVFVPDFLATARYHTNSAHSQEPL
jgi:hypothetical protein